jgi:hypothetical protein
MRAGARRADVLAEPLDHSHFLGLDLVVTGPEQDEASEGNQRSRNEPEGRSTQGRHAEGAQPGAEGVLLPAILRHFRSPISSPRSKGSA